jgi:hypothetical protein
VIGILPNDRNNTARAFLAPQNRTCAIRGLSVIVKSLTVICNGLLSKLGKMALATASQANNNQIYSIDTSLSMIVHQDVDLLHALQSSRDASDALETLEQLTTMQQWSEVRLSA